MAELTHPKPKSKLTDIAIPTPMSISHALPLTFPRLRKCSLNFEPSSKYWRNVQQLLSESPIEIFHIIKDSADKHRIANPPRHEPFPFPTLPPLALLNGLGMHIHHPEPDTDQPIIATTFEPGTTPPVFPPPNNPNDPFHAPIAVEDGRQQPLIGLGLGLPTDERWRSGAPPVVNPDFVREFLGIHEETLKQFWVSGMRLMRPSLDILVHGPESSKGKGKASTPRWSKLDRIRALEVDEFPVSISQSSWASLKSHTHHVLFGSIV